MLRRLLILATALGAMTASAATVPGGASATIAPPGIVLVRTSSLSFGTIAPSSNSGTVIVDPTAGTTTSSGGVSVVAAGNAASFRASSTANANQFFWVEVPDDSTVFLTRAGSPDLLMRAFTVSANVVAGCVVQSGAAAPPNSAKATCPAVKSGVTFSFQVGGTLDVPPNPPAGTYTGAFSIIIHRF